MTITFVETLPEPVRGKGRKRDPKWDNLAEALRGRPGQWAVVEQGHERNRSQMVRILLGLRGPWFDVKYRQGTVYARFAPPPFVQ